MLLLCALTVSRVWFRSLNSSLDKEYPRYNVKVLLIDAIVLLRYVQYSHLFALVAEFEKVMLVRLTICLLAVTLCYVSAAPFSP